MQKANDAQNSHTLIKSAPCCSHPKHNSLSMHAQHYLCTPQLLHTRQTISAMLSSNCIAATQNTTHSPCTSTCTKHTPSTTQPTALHNSPMHTTNPRHSWQNGTRCRDGVKVLWCCSHLVWLVFEGFIPTCACFRSENFFVTCI